MKTPHLSSLHINSAGSRGQHQLQLGHGDKSELLAPQLEKLKSCLPTQTAGLTTPATHNVLSILILKTIANKCEQAKSKQSLK